METRTKSKKVRAALECDDAMPDFAELEADLAEAEARWRAELVPLDPDVIARSNTLIESLKMALEIGVPAEAAMRKLLAGADAIRDTSEWKLPEGREVWLEPRLKAGLKAYARANDVSLSAALARAVRSYLKAAHEAA